MDTLIGYSILAGFFLIVIIVLERTKRRMSGFSDFATGGRSFGLWFQSMSFMNTWLPGSIFITFAASTVAAGVLGFYVLLYSLGALMVMFFMARPVSQWGAKFDLRTQAELLGFRYKSPWVRRTAAFIGLACIFPWAILGFQSLAAVFSALGYGSISAGIAIIISIAVLALRQIWTLRMGMRGIIISDMVQGIFAYGVGLLVCLGALVWLLSNGHGIDSVPSSHFALPGPNSPLGGLYYFSITFTGIVGGWCWPDIFVRLFTAKSTRTLKQSAALSSVMLLVFCTALMIVALLATSVSSINGAPNEFWFKVTAFGGPVLVAFAGLCVLGATMGNIDALIQTTSAQITNDFGRKTAAATGVHETRIAQIGAIVMTALAALGALIWGDGVGLNTLAIISYSGIVQIGPAIYFGIFWRRGNSASALIAMVSGFVTAVVLQALYPISIPWLGGITSGVVGFAVNCGAYIASAYLIPSSQEDHDRVNAIFDGLKPRPKGAVSHPQATQVSGEPVG